MTNSPIAPVKEKQSSRPAELVRFEPARRRVRVYLNGEVLADTENAMLLWEWHRPPYYYFPLEDVRTEFLEKSDKTSRRPSIGEAQYWHVQVGDRREQNAAWSYAETRPEAPDLNGYIAFKFHVMDAWFEEDDEIYVHPKDPYVRVDALTSSRHVRVEVEGEIVAETDRPVLLYETGLITRYYIPKIDVRQDLLASSETHTSCPYKGMASYYSLKIGGELREDLVWYYPQPFAEVAKIQNLLCFYNEKVDIYVDGELQERPKSVFA